MRRLLPFLLLISALAADASAQVRTTGGGTLVAPQPAAALSASLTASAACSAAPGAGSARLDVSGYASAAIQVTGTWSGTLSFEVSADLDGSTYQTVTAVPSNSTTTATTATNNGIWGVSVTGDHYLCVRFSSYSSGTAVVTMRAALAGGGSGGSGVAAIASQVGSPVPSTATAVAARDASGNLAYFKFDGSGNLLTSVTGAGAGGTSSTDGDGYTAATNAGTALMGAKDDTGTTVCAENKVCIARIDANRELMVSATNGAGNVIATEATLAALNSVTVPQLHDDLTNINLLVAGVTGALGTDGATPPSSTTAVAGFDGTNIQTIKTDTSGNVSVIFAAAQAVTQSGSWSLAANQSVNVAQINGVTTTMGNGVSGTGVQRVSLASDSTGNIATIGTSVTPGTAAANLGKAEDAASASADVGVYVLSVRQDAPAGSTSTDGDYQSLKTDSIGRLWVNCGTGCSGGTQFAEDAAHTTADVGTEILSRRIDSPGSSAGTSGDYATVNTDANGLLWVNPFGATQAAATYLTTRLSDGTNFLTPSTDQTEDAASAGAETGPMVLSVRKDTPSSGGQTSTDGDFQTLVTDAFGRLWVNCGTGCSGGTQYTQDAALTVATTVGTMAMGRASAAVPTDVSADGDAVIPWYLRSGAQATQPTYGGVLAVAGNGASGTGVQRVTIANDSTGILATVSTVTSLSQFAGNAISTNSGNVGAGVLRTVLSTDQPAMVGLGIYTEDAAETAGGNLSMAGSVRRDTAASSAGSTGDNSTINTDANGYLWTRTSDPCTSLTKVYVPINISTATTTQLIAASASNNNYICSINLVAGGADNVGLIEDDTAACASPTAGMAGGTTAASGWNLAANGGLAHGDGQATVFKTATTNRYTCLITSAAQQLSGTISYVQAP